MRMIATLENDRMVLRIYDHGECFAVELEPRWPPSWPATCSATRTPRCSGHACTMAISSRGRSNSGLQSQNIREHISAHWPCRRGSSIGSLTTLREKLVKVGARIVRHGRYVVFQLAEVAVPRAPFAKILPDGTLAAEAAAVLGMRIESDERQQPDR
jgi:hypothetical protein